MTAAVFAVMVPLVVADLTRGTGHFNLGQGIVGTFTGIGASLSATLAGYMSDRFGSPSAFAGAGRDRIGRLGDGVVFDAGNAAGRRGEVVAVIARSEATKQPIAVAGLLRSARKAKVQRRGVVGDEPQMRRGAVGQAAVDGEIILRHAPRGETLFETLPDLFARQMTETVDSADSAIIVLDDESSQAIFDDFRHRAAIERDHRRAAGHGFDHHQAERLRPIDRNQQSDRAAQEIPISPCR